MLHDGQHGVEGLAVRHALLLRVLAGRDVRLEPTGIQVDLAAVGLSGTRPHHRHLGHGGVHLEFGRFNTLVKAVAVTH